MVIVCSPSCGRPTWSSPWNQDRSRPSERWLHNQNTLSCVVSQQRHIQFPISRNVQKQFNEANLTLRNCENFLILWAGYHPVQSSWRFWCRAPGHEVWSGTSPFLQILTWSGKLLTKNSRIFTDFDFLDKCPITGRKKSSYMSSQTLQRVPMQRPFTPESQPVIALKQSCSHQRQESLQ